MGFRQEQLREDAVELYKEGRASKVEGKFIVNRCYYYAPFTMNAEPRFLSLNDCLKGVLIEAHTLHHKRMKIYCHGREL